MKTPQPTASSNGIYRLPPDPAPLRAAAAEAGLCWFGVDLRRARGKRALLNAFDRALQFPATFGGNWDALADSLQDLSWLPGPNRILALRGAGDFAAAKGDEHEVLLEILGATAEYWGRQARVFIVLSDAPALPSWRAG